MAVIPLWCGGIWGNGKLLAEWNNLDAVFLNSAVDAVQ